MAQMTQSQIDAELMRKIASGESKASSAANQARMDLLRAAQQQATGRASVYGAMAAQPGYKTPEVKGPGVPDATVPGDPNVSRGMASFYAAAAAAKNPTQQDTAGKTGPIIATDTGVGVGAGAGGGSTPQTYIDGLTDAQRAATLAQFEKSKNQSLSNLQGERAAIAPKYYDQRNAAAAGSQQQARNFAEFMAARGGTNSGANAQAELSRGMQLQGDLGTLGRQEAAAFTDIERRTTDVNNGYQSDIAGAEAGLQRDRMQLLLSDYYRAQDRGDRLKQQEIENEFARAGLTGMLNNNGTQTRTIQGQSLDQSILDSNRNFKYQQGRDMVGDQQWQKSFDEDRKRYGDQAAYQKVRDSVQDTQWKTQFDEQVRQFGLKNALDSLQTNANIANMRADNARQAANSGGGSGGGGGSSAASNAKPAESADAFAREVAAMDQTMKTGKLTYDQAVAGIKKDQKAGYYTEYQANRLIYLLEPYKPKVDKSPMFQPGY